MEIPIHIRIIDGPSLANQVLSPEAKRSILARVGAKLKWLTVQNFGSTGKDRPSPWPQLSRRYARRVGRSEATLELSGDLFRSLRVSPATDEFVDVYTDDPKAEYHHEGTEHMPKRRFFPVTDDGELTPYARNVLEQTAKLEVERLLRQL